MGANFSSTQFEAVYDLPHSERLTQMIADARLLQSYLVRTASSQNEDFLAELTDVLYTLEHLLSQATPNGALKETEKRFLVLYDKLASLAAPVSAQSIRHTIEAKKARFFGPTTLAATTALLVFVLMVLSQGYWVVGKRFRDQIQRHEIKRVELEIKKYSADDSHWLVEQRKSRLAANNCEETDDFEEAARPGQTSSERASLERRKLEKAKKCTLKTSLDEEQLRLQLVQKPLQRDLQEVLDLTAPAMTVAADWYTISATPTSEDWEKTFMESIDKIRHEATSKKNEISVRAATANPIAARFLTLETRRIDLDTGMQVQAALKAVEQRKARVLIHRIDVLLDIFQSYIIPSLLGLLGALVFVLRDTSLRL
jgi:hypothetical protein